MPPDRIRQLANQRDKAMARPHRLEPERLVLPARGESSARRVCSKGCGWVISDWSWKQGKGPMDCPRDGAALVLVEG
jgi:hypothetical protein